MDRGGGVLAPAGEAVLLVVADVQVEALRSRLIDLLALLLRLLGALKASVERLYGGRTCSRNSLKAARSARRSSQRSCQAVPVQREA